jgi:hypothetical protein
MYISQFEIVIYITPVSFLNTANDVKAFKRNMSDQSYAEAGLVIGL